MDEPTRLAPARSNFPPWMQALLLVAATTAVYWNSLNTPFVFDDIPAIVENESIRNLWSPVGPPRAGSAVDGRPVVNWSFAVNYALSGDHPRGYHVTNLLIHAGAGLLLWGLLQRTLRRVMVPAWVRELAEPIAWASALVWLLHPLQTESVTCVVQRTESLAGLVYLFALYAFARATDPVEPASRQWIAVSLAAAWLGMATKETMATLPLILVLYDRTFAAGSFRAAWRQRPWYYAGLAASWLLLAALMIPTQGRGGTITLDRDVTAWMSLLTQSRAIIMYLGLALWPHPLVLDYGNFVTDTVTSLRQVAPQFLIVSGLGLAVLYALARRPLAGFIGAWFFLILGPSSSFIPLLTQMRAEHRMYLPLAAVVVSGVALLWRQAGRAAPWLAGVWALALGAATVARNHDYRSERAIWTDTAEKQPGNPRVHYSRAIVLERDGELAPAEQACREALRLKPDYLEANLELANILLRAGRVAEARPLLEKVGTLGPDTSNLFNSLGHAYALSGDADRALVAFEQAVRLDPRNHEAHNNLGYYLAAKGRRDEAIAHFQESVALHPGPVAWGNLGAAFLEGRETDRAITAFTEALRFEPDSGAGHYNLGRALATAARYEAAATQFAQAVRADATHAGAWYNLGLMQRHLGRTAEAREAFRRVLTLEADNKGAARQLESLGP